MYPGTPAGGPRAPLSPYNLILPDGRLSHTLGSPPSVAVLAQNPGLGSHKPQSYPEQPEVEPSPASTPAPGPAPFLPPAADLVTWCVLAEGSLSNTPAWPGLTQSPAAPPVTSPKVYIFKTLNIQRQGRIWKGGGCGAVWGTVEQGQVWRWDSSSLTDVSHQPS